MRHRRRRRSRGQRLLATALVAAGLVVASVVSYQQLSGGDSGARGAARQTPPATGEPSPGAGASGAPADEPLWAGTPSPAAAIASPLTALPTTAPIPTSAGLSRQLAPPLADPILGGDTVSVVVADPRTGATLLSNHGSDAVMPASTSKLAVAIAALETLGPQARFTTSAVIEPPGQAGPDQPGSIQGAPARVVLVGGGDPTLAGPKAVGVADPGFPEPARLSDLAGQAASALKAKGITSVSVGYDASMYAGPPTAPGWKPLYVTEGDVAPVSALEVDEGRPDPTKAPRTSDPALLAAQDFAALLTADGVTVAGAPSAVPKAPDATALASVDSPTLGTLVQRMLGVSDNDLAEALARHVAIATGQPPTFAGGAAAVKAALAKLGVDVSGLAMVDASGLSRSDRVQPRLLVNLLDLVLTAPDRHDATLSPMLQALPVAGFSGTLARRYTTAPANAAAGDVHAKTGTLDGVVALAGYLDDASGRVLSFALIANGVPIGATARTEAALDKAAARLAGCGCS